MNRCLQIVLVVGCLGSSQLSAQNVARPTFVARFDDGSLVRSPELSGWEAPGGSPTLGKRPLFGANPMRWLRNESVRPGRQPSMWVETVTGDILPGRVVSYSDVLHRGNETVEPCFHVLPSVQLLPSESPQDPSLRVIASMVRRIVWKRSTRDLQPGRAWLRDGSERSFRQIRFSANRVSLLTEDGPQRFSWSEFAELHLPRGDFWSAYFDELSRLSPHARGRLIQVQTADGLLATTSAGRLLPQTRGGSLSSKRWLHVIQPAWSLDALWVPSHTTTLWRSASPFRVLLSRCPPDDLSQQTLVAPTPIRWRRDKTVAGAQLKNRTASFGWGWGVHGQMSFSFRLPKLAKRFRATLALDRTAGDGGCIRGRVLAGAKVLFTSPIMIGADRTAATDWLTLSDRLLQLQIDPVLDQRPRGADPFDIRDAVIWGEPEVELDSNGLTRELALRRPQTVRAWRGWQVAAPESLEFRQEWDEVAPSPGRFRFAVVSSKGPLRLERTLSVTASSRWLVVLASHARPADKSPSLSVRVNGRVVQQQPIEAYAPGHEKLKPIIIDLSPFRDKKCELVVEQSASPTPVHWHLVASLERLPHRRVLLDDGGSLAQVDASGRELTLPRLARRTEKQPHAGRDSLLLEGNTNYRLAFPGRMAFRDKPGWSEYRYIRFAVRKPQGGALTVGFVRDDALRPVVKYTLGKVPSVEKNARRLYPTGLPREWAVVTIDLFKEAGNQDLKAIIFRSLDENHAQIDRVVVANSLEALDD